MIWDLARKDGPGAYGEGLAAPLGDMRWLNDMAGPLTFRRLHMGEAGDLRFPYHLLKHEARLPLTLPHRPATGHPATYPCTACGEHSMAPRHFPFAQQWGWCIALSVGRQQFLK